MCDAPKFGTLQGINLCLCLFLQLDTEYRKKWDSLVIKLEVVDRDTNTGSEVVHWATHFPVSVMFVLRSVCKTFLHYFVTQAKHG